MQNPKNNILNSILLSILVAAGIGGVIVYNVRSINSNADKQTILGDQSTNQQNQDQVNSSGNELESEVTATLPTVTKPTPSAKPTYKPTYRRENDDEEEGDDDNEGSYTTTNNTPTTNPTPTPTATYTLSDVKLHTTRTSCWTTVNGKVYDVTNFINQHPGGANAILSLCGIDGSAAFNGQHGGQARPTNELASFIIGTLK